LRSLVVEREKPSSDSEDMAEGSLALLELGLD
jgi:hypothetical protein